MTSPATEQRSDHGPGQRPGQLSGWRDRLARVIALLVPPGAGLPWRAADAAEPGVPLRERFRVAQDDLLREYTLAEVEAHERAVDPLGGVAPVPFGHLNPVWQRFVAALQPGDRIWRFNAQRVSANGEAVIRSGYVAVRAGIAQRPLVASFRTVDANTPLGALAASTAPVTPELTGPRPAPGAGQSSISSADDKAMNGPERGLPALESSPRTMIGQEKRSSGADAPTKDSTIAALPHHQEPATVE